MKTRLLIFLALLMTACADEAVPSPAEELTLRAELEQSVAACKADEECMASLENDSEILQSCPWYEAVGCSVVVAGAVAVCVDPLTMEECEPALIAVKAIGCCDCLPKGWVQDACKTIGDEP